MLEIWINMHYWNYKAERFSIIDLINIDVVDGRIM